jgi:hypothetical protein
MIVIQRVGGSIGLEAAMSEKAVTVAAEFVGAVAGQGLGINQKASEQIGCLGVAVFTGHCFGLPEHFLKPRERIGFFRARHPIP